jgi:hypothetical protein
VLKDVRETHRLVSIHCQSLLHVVHDAGRRRGGFQRSYAAIHLAFWRHLSRRSRGGHAAFTPVHHVLLQIQFLRLVMRQVFIVVVVPPSFMIEVEFRVTSIVSEYKGSRRMERISVDSSLLLGRPNFASKVCQGTVVINTVCIPCNLQCSLSVCERYGLSDLAKSPGGKGRCRCPRLRYVCWS